MDELNFREMDPCRRLRSIVSGDPAGDYYGFPDIQLMIIGEDAAIAAEQIANQAGKAAVLSSIDN